MRIPGNAEKGGQTRTSNESPGREPPRDGRAHEPGASGREGTPRTITQASQSRRPEPEVAWATPTSVSRRGLVGGCAPLQPQAARWPLGPPSLGTCLPQTPRALGPTRPLSRRISRGRAVTPALPGGARGLLPPALRGCQPEGLGKGNPPAGTACNPSPKAPGCSRRSRSLRAGCGRGRAEGLPALGPPHRASAQQALGPHTGPFSLLGTSAASPSPRVQARCWTGCRPGPLASDGSPPQHPLQGATPHTGPWVPIPPAHAPRP